MSALSRTAVRLVSGAALLSGCATTTPSSDLAVTRPPGIMRGAFIDDYGNVFDISDTLFAQQPHGRFEIVEWHVQEQFVVARNADSNASDPGLWTRIDWVPLPNMPPYTWAFCFTAFRAPSRQAARDTPAPDRTNPRTGCNGYPFSRMKPALR